MEKYIFETRIEVRDYECDIEGIVNNANYVHYCEHTRHLFLQQCGLSFAEMMRSLGSRNPVKGLKCSLTGRNLFLCTRYTGADPQVMPSAANGTGGMGIDNYNVPTMRSFNFNVNVTF